LMKVLMPALAASGKMECCVSGWCAVWIPKSWMAGTSPSMTVLGEAFRELVWAGQEVMKSVSGPVSEQVMKSVFERLSD
jgi:hypothetical protein